jgi:hypothetical protein
VGVPAAFVVHAYDRHKNRAWRGGEQFGAALRGPDGQRVELSLTDQGDGTYSGSMVCRQVGMHHLETFLASDCMLIASLIRWACITSRRFLLLIAC